ncbi:MAG TPA: VCBS repeat-containing protein, partial [Candidatus Hydrogenedentes bacterium]|nr:VCBS repeat-containing protein [Candidatus Hydrogenedentota bacterium]
VHEFDGDKTPELVVAARDGVHIFSKEGGAYVEAAVLDVLPPLRPAHGEQQLLWPPEKRRIVFPARQMNCRVYLVGNEIGVLSWHDARGAQIVYELVRYAVDPGKNYALDAKAPEVECSAPLPPHIRPCRLDKNEQLDFAGGEWELAEAAVLPVPIFETYASLDGGRTSQTRRTRSFRPNCSFVDFDGDGDLDMVTEQTGLFEGGVRESINRFLTQRHVEHSVQVYRQDARGRFPRLPDVSGRFTIYLDAAPFHGSGFFHCYLAGELLNIAGDFDGDGYNDVLLRDRSDRLSVFLAAGRGFESVPAARLFVPHEARVGVADVNGDGLSDIVVRSFAERENGRAEISRVFLARAGEEP